MKNKITILVLVFGFAFATFGVAYATTDWNDDNMFNGTVNWFKNGIRIGQQGSGGVTFFNGTIVNETTNNDADNPVAFGDNVRIDGEIWRGETAGPGDNMPVKINDDLTVYGDIEGISLGIDDVEGLRTDLTYLNDTKANTDDVYTKSESNSTFVSQSSPSWNARTGYITVSSAAFTPREETYNYTNWGLELYDQTAGASAYVAPVQLPHGATVTRVDCYYKDNTANNLTLYLAVTARKGSATSMAAITTTGSSSQYTSASDTTINVATVDNTSYSYFLDLSFPGNDGSSLVFSGADIHYSYSEPY